jgi:hypothetical protein
MTKWTNRDIGRIGETRHRRKWERYSYFEDLNQIGCDLLDFIAILGISYADPIHPTHAIDSGHVDDYVLRLMERIPHFEANAISIKESQLSAKRTDSDTNI